MLADVYAKRTGKSREEMLSLMDDDTLLLGQEIIDHGFASVMLDSEDAAHAMSTDEAMSAMNEVYVAMLKEGLSFEQWEDQMKACIGGCQVNDENATSSFQDLPMIDRPWDGAAAVQRVRNFVGATEAPNRRYRDAFFWYNSAEPNNFGSFKLPFADVVNGELVANIRGVNAANGAMSGARGGVQIPQSDRAAVQSHIDRYKAKWDREQGGGDGNDPQSNLQEEVFMNLEEFKASHPDLFAQAVALGETNLTAVTAELNDAKAKNERTADIVAMAYEHKVSKEKALEMLAADTAEKAELIALKARETQAPAIPVTDLNADEKAAQEKAAAEYAVNLAKTLKIN